MKTLKEMIITKEGVTVEIAKYINGEIKLEDMSAHGRQLVNDLRYVDIFKSTLKEIEEESIDAAELKAQIWKEYKKAIKLMPQLNIVLSDSDVRKELESINNISELKESLEELNTINKYKKEIEELQKVFDTLTTKEKVEALYELYKELGIDFDKKDIENYYATNDNTDDSSMHYTIPNLQTLTRGITFPDLRNAFSHNAIDIEECGVTCREEQPKEEPNKEQPKEEPKKEQPKEEPKKSQGTNVQNKTRIAVRCIGLVQHPLIMKHLSNNNEFMKILMAQDIEKDGRFKVEFKDNKTVVVLSNNAKEITIKGAGMGNPVVKELTTV